MSDLTDEELKCWMREDLAPPLHELLLELQRHRSAQAVSEEQVEMVVHEICNNILADEAPKWSIANHQRVCDTIATRAAKQLAGVVPVVLTAAERSQLEHHIRDHEATCAYSCSIIRRLLGTP